MQVERDVATNDECLRCGYNLTGIANDQACPECGLLAERSRRVTDELHQSRPRWLKRLSRGVWLIVVALVVPLPTLFAPDFIRQWVWEHESYLRANGWWSNRWSSSHIEFACVMIALYVPAICLTRGVFLLTSREGYASADAAGWMRRAFREALVVPWVVVGLIHAGYQLDWDTHRAAPWIVLALATFGIIPLVILTSLRLRNLAARARSQHLAEHCVIVGIGTAATLVYVFTAAFVQTHADEWFGNYWNSRGAASLVVELVMSVCGLLFILWQVYLLVRFAIAFGKAAKMMRQEWKRDDRAATHIVAEAPGPVRG